MKIRMGFVSNSSSSSFFLYGVQLNIFDDEKILKENFVPANAEYNNNYDIFEYIYGKMSDDFEIGTDYDSENITIGRCPTTIEDNQTMLEWKNNIKNKLKKFFPNIDYNWYKDCYFD